jgi:transcriptional regulator of acetoin/glycerol metabolism
VTIRDQPETGASEQEEAILFTPGMTMQELERAAIVATLAAVNGNRRKASEQLGIGERTLYRKLKEYNIEI